MFGSVTAAIVATLIGGGLAVATTIGVVSSVNSTPDAKAPSESTVINYGTTN